ncbi:MAG: DUF4271 domain-containing protein [Bacteroidaceae bacterium]|nr:DUF4271 domain-containing protein [Bacteroidaceae bacterium]
MLPPVPSPVYALRTDTVGTTTALPGVWDSQPQLAGVAVQTATARGVVGELLPYNPRTDNVVTAALLVSTFITVWVAVRSWGFVLHTAVGFFYDLVPRRARPTDGVDIDEVGDNRLLHLHAAFLLALAYMGYACDTRPAEFVGRAPYSLLLAGMGLFTAWYLVRAVAYRFIDAVFFDKWQHNLWTQVRTQCTFLTNLLLLPLLLVAIYFALDVRVYATAVFFIIGVSRFVLLMKCYRTFFAYRWGTIHLLLYFCTLEIAPLFALWRFLGAAG